MPGRFAVPLLRFIGGLLIVGRLCRWMLRSGFSDMASLSRGALCVRAVLIDPPLRRRGHGECRALAAPMARLQKKSRRQSPQVQPRTPGIPRAMVLTAASRSPRCAGLSGHRIAQRACARCAGHQHRDARTTRLDRAHQRRSSARLSHAATSTRPPHPASTFVTTAKRPSCETGRTRGKHDFWKKETEIFLLEWPARAMCLNRRAK